jgi:hypothetical protein
VKHSYSISVEPESGGESRRKKGETSAGKRENGAGVKPFDGGDIEIESDKGELR